MHLEINMYIKYKTNWSYENVREIRPEHSHGYCPMLSNLAAYNVYPSRFKPRFYKKIFSIRYYYVWYTAAIIIKNDFKKTLRIFSRLIEKRRTYTIFMRIVIISLVLSN